MILKTLVVSDWGVNCYLLGDETSREAVVIDPGAEGERILEEAGSLGLDIKLIVNTHGHGDHIGGNRVIHEATGAPIAVGRSDSEFLTNPELNLSTLIADIPVVSPPAARLLDDGDEIQVGGIRLQVLATPGHTPGGISLSVGDAVFTGDALFYGSIGRTDFPYCDTDLLLRSIRERLLVLPDHTVVYPGHGSITTIGDERRMNPCLAYQ